MAGIAACKSPVRLLWEAFFICPDGRGGECNSKFIEAIGGSVSIIKRKKSPIQEKARLCAIMAGALLFPMPGMIQAQAAEEFALDQVVVTANRVPTERSKAAANITVVTREQIEQGGYFSLGDVLRDVNGVIVSGKGFAGANQSVRLNGDDRVLVMIDGRRIGRPEGTGTGRANLDLSTMISLKNIERIEIVKGGASALYGSDAVGGVINVITRKGAQAENVLDVAAGSWGGRNYSLSTQGSENSWSWYITAERKEQDYTKYNVLNPELTSGSGRGESRRWANSKFEGQAFTVRLDKQITDDRSISFHFEHWNDDGGQPFGVQFPYTVTGAHLSNNAALTYDFNRQSAVPGFIRLYTNYNSQDFSGKYQSRTNGLQYQTGWQLGDKHKVIAGVDWQTDKVLNNITSDGIVNYKNKSINNMAVYLQDIYHFTDKWTVTPGMRYDHHSKFGGQTSPEISVNYSADETTDIYAAYGRVFKAPNLDDLYYYMPGWGMYGDPDLQPEKGHVFSLGVNKKINQLTAVSASYFNSEITNAIDWVEGPPWTYYVKNMNKEKKHGLELDVTHQLSPKYFVEAGYSYVKVEQDTGSGYHSDGKNSQPNGYRIKLGYRDNQWGLSLNGESAAGRDRDYFVDRGYWVWNFAANYKLSDRSIVYFNANNLTDKAYEINGRSSLTSVQGNYPMPSRNFQLGVRHLF